MKNTVFNENLKVIIYIINLDTAIDRRKSVEKELKKTTIPYQFVSAVNKHTISNVNYEVKNKYKRPLIPAEIGCFLSHVKIKELFLKTDYDFAIILEDDIELLEDFDTQIKKVVNQFASLPLKKQWDVLKLPSQRRKKLYPIQPIDSNYSLYGGGVGITTMAAIWTRKGAQSFLNTVIKKNQRIIKMPIDCALQHPWEYGLNIYNIVPEIVDEKIFESQIRPTKRLKSNTFTRVIYEAKKTMPRFYYNLRAFFLKY